jgi:hypothetical protein
MGTSCFVKEQNINSHFFIRSSHSMNSKLAIFGSITTLLLAVIIIGLWAPSSGTSGTPAGSNMPGHKCNVGGQPSLDIRRVLPHSGVELKSNPLIIGCGSFPSYGPIEFVGYLTSEGFCYAVDSPKRHNSEGGICLKDESNWQLLCGGQPVCPHSVIPVKVGTESFSRVIGELSPEVHQLIARTGKLQMLGAVVRLGPALKGRLHIEHPITVFAAVLPGCWRGIALLGKDKSGSVIDRTSARAVGPSGC